jgi:hypothetical protein
MPGGFLRSSEDIGTTARPTSWGKWQFDPASFQLEHASNTCEYYTVDLATCVNSAAVLDRIAQFRAKNSADDPSLASLVRALDDILDLQASICTNGRITLLRQGRWLPDAGIEQSTDQEIRDRTELRISDPACNFAGWNDGGGTNAN